MPNVSPESTCTRSVISNHLAKPACHSLNCTSAGWLDWITSGDDHFSVLKAHLLHSPQLIADVGREQASRWASLPLARISVMQIAGTDGYVTRCGLSSASFVLPSALARLRPPFCPSPAATLVTVSTSAPFIFTQ